MHPTAPSKHRLALVCLLLVLLLRLQSCQRKPDVQEEIKKLQATDKDVREAAVKALVQIGQPAVDPLIKALKTDNPSVQAAAARALGLIGDKRAVMPLIDMMKNSYNLELMHEVFLALSQIGDEQTCDALKRAMRGSNTIVSRYAKKILAESGLCKSKKNKKKKKK